MRDVSCEHDFPQPGRCCMKCGVYEPVAWMANIERLRERITELEAALRMMLPAHSGSCCTFDAAGKVIVTVESCQCTADVKWARAALSGADADGEGK